MKWSLGDLAIDNNQRMAYQEEINLTIKDLPNIARLRDIQTLTINGVWYYDEINDHLYTEFNLSGDITVSGSLTLRDFTHHIDVDSIEVFGFDQLDDVADHLVSNEEVDLLPIIKQLVVANIPVKTVEEDYEYPIGDGWELVSESSLIPDEDLINPKMAKLLELEIEDD
ncbi:MAG: DUF177 domain-containing protein [Erysipelothrix sp.]|nr:DUF177 domain-containing protein [Erysipelothrix sp.]